MIMDKFYWIGLGIAMFIGAFTISIYGFTHFEALASAMLCWIFFEIVIRNSPSKSKEKK